MKTRLDLKAASPGNNANWSQFFLQHLDEFVALSWYLVADNRLVEATIKNTLISLGEIPFDASVPELAYHQAREMLIARAMAALRLGCNETGKDDAFQPSTLVELPDLPRLAFTLKLILRSSETEIAKLLNIPASRVKELIRHAIYRLSVSMPLSIPGGCYDA